MIEVQNVRKWYGPKLAVDGVSFTVQKGEILGFLGPNGAGKSTTMKMITGYLPPSEGSIRVAGHDVVGDSLTLAHFSVEHDRVLLTPDGRREFLRLYEQQLLRRVHHPLARGAITLRQALELHVRMAYQPFAGERDDLEPIGWR